MVCMGLKNIDHKRVLRKYALKPLTIQVTRTSKRHMEARCRKFARSTRSWITRVGAHCLQEFVTVRVKTVLKDDGLHELEY